MQPHYDDNDLGAGGTFAALADAGCEVHYLTVTDDLLGVLDASLSDADARDVLRAEQEVAGREIGIASQTWLEHPDAGDWRESDLRGELILHIRRLRPDWVFTVDPWLPYESHPDHLKVARACTQAVMFHGLPRLATEPDVDRGYTPHEIEGVGFYFTRDGNRVVDVTRTSERKQRAIGAYRAQFTDENLAALQRGLAGLEEMWAAHESFAKGEPLKILRPSHLHVNLLPVS